MTEPSAFQATFADFKLVRTRKVIQLIFECPLEQANDILKVTGGMPNASEEKWFAIARLNNKTKEAREKREFGALPPATQAALLLKRQSFQVFLDTECLPPGCVKVGEDGDENAVASADKFLKELFGIQSKSDLSTNPIMSKRWRDLMEEYNNWLHEPEFIG